MKDGIVRTFIKLIAGIVYFIDLKITRFFWKLSGVKSYHLRGECSKCGACCVSPSIQVGKLVWNIGFFEICFLVWQKYVNGFEFVDRESQGRIYVFKCNHYNSEKNECDSYFSRPVMCRDYPKALTYQINPVFFKTCTLRPIDKKAKKILDKLQTKNMTEEQIELIKKELFLE